MRRLLVLLLASLMLFATAACGDDSRLRRRQPSVDMGDKISG